MYTVVQNLIRAILLLVFIFNSIPLSAQNQLDFSGDNEAEKLVKEAMVCRANFELEQYRVMIDQALTVDHDNLMANFLKIDMDPFYASQHLNQFDELLANGNEDEQKLIKLWKNVSLSEQWKSERIAIRNLRPLLYELAKKYKGDPYLMMQLGVIAKRMNDVDKAIEIFQSILEGNNEMAPPYNMLGYIYMEQGQLDTAKKYFDKYLSLAPELANPYDSQGDYYMTKGDYAKALEMFEKSYSINPAMTISKEKAEQAKMKLKDAKK
ncbi:tetratricopeptide repeat protein [Limibacter armeniacum]|uniref:tetratricopeptide repeat protein n=1 Tax=Limibacter armeniacum TaxID=466084 RepID=UPI002FE59197